MNKEEGSALVQLGRGRGAGQVPQDVSARVWPALAGGLEPEGAAGHAQEPPLSCVVRPWAWLWVTTPPIRSPAFVQIGVTGVASKGMFGFAPCDAVVPIASGVSRTGVGVSLLIFLFVSLT